MQIIKLDAENSLFVQDQTFSDRDNLIIMATLVKECAPISYLRMGNLTHRKTSYHVDNPATMRYWYTNQEVAVDDWNPTLIALRHLADEFTSKSLKKKIQFNSALCQFYPHRDAWIAWHSDDETIYDVGSPVTSLSFGGSRRFQFRHKDSLKPVSANGLGDDGGIDLRGDMICIMAGPSFQQRYQHSVKKGTSASQPRFSVTFRIHNEKRQFKLTGNIPRSRYDVLDKNVKAAHKE